MDLKNNKPMISKKDIDDKTDSYLLNIIPCQDIIQKSGLLVIEDDIRYYVYKNRWRHAALGDQYVTDFYGNETSVYHLNFILIKQSDLVNQIDQNKREYFGSSRWLTDHLENNKYILFDATH